MHFRIFKWRVHRESHQVYSYLCSKQIQICTRYMRTTKQVSFRVLPATWLSSLTFAERSYFLNFKWRIIIFSTILYALYLLGRIPHVIIMTSLLLILVTRDQAWDGSIMKTVEKTKIKKKWPGMDHLKNAMSPWRRFFSSVAKSCDVT